MVCSCRLSLQEAGIELVAGVRAGMRQRMMEVDWLDTDTRKLALEKVGRVHVIIFHTCLSIVDVPKILLLF